MPAVQRAEGRIVLPDKSKKSRLFKYPVHRRMLGIDNHNPVIMGLKMEKGLIEKGSADSSAPGVRIDYDVADIGNHVIPLSRQLDINVPEDLSAFRVNEYFRKRTGAPC